MSGVYTIINLLTLGHCQLHNQFLVYYYIWLKTQNFWFHLYANSSFFA